MDQKILCISGRKQAGKDTCCRFLASLLGSVEPPQKVRQFYYAEPLKRLCVDILGCPADLVYGTDSDKNQLVPHLLWENFPVPVLTDGTVVRTVGRPFSSTSAVGSIFHIEPPFKRGPGLCLRKGPMTVREVLQFWGSEIFRRQYEDVWADACIRAIRKSQVPFAVITDCRFQNEVFAAQAANGRVIRLDRAVFPEDTHTSEVSLDPDRFDWGHFDHVIRNSELTAEEQCIALYIVLYDFWGWVPSIPIDVVAEHARRAAT